MSPCPKPRTCEYHITQEPWKCQRPMHAWQRSAASCTALQFPPRSFTCTTFCKYAFQRPERCFRALMAAGLPRQRRVRRRKLRRWRLRRPRLRPLPSTCISTVARSWTRRSRRRSLASRYAYMLLYGPFVHPLGGGQCRSLRCRSMPQACLVTVLTVSYLLSSTLLFPRFVRALMFHPWRVVVPHTALPVSKSIQTP